MKDFETAKNVLVNTSNWSYEDRHFSNRHAWLIAVAALYLLQWPLPIVRAQCPATNWRSGVTEVVGPHGSPDVSGAQGVIYATLSWDPDGPGGMNPWLVVGGDFELKGDFSSQNIAAWDGERWRPMGAGLSGGAVFALAAYDSGNGPELYAGGQFLNSGGEIIRQLARWDGQNWTKLANGLSGSSSNHVAAMIVFDDGTGSQLYFSGNGLGVLRWNGSTLSTIPGPGNAFTMAVFDDGSGPALFVGGRFNATLGNGLNANNIAKWDGASWSALGIGILGNSTSSPSVNSLASFHDANGPALYVGGEFNRAGGVTCSNIAKWSGQSWSALPDPQPFYRVSSMHVFQNGQTESLYMGTGVTGSSSNFYGSLRIWDGTHWQVAPPLSAARALTAQV